MNDKFSLYQTDGLWGIIENASDEKQTSIKSYFGSDLIIKRLNEQDQQIDQLKQQLAEKDKEIERLKDFIGCKGCVDVIKKSNKDQTQLAIQELEKMKNWCRGSLNVSLTLYDEIKDYINQQIKELKGE